MANLNISIDDLAAEITLAVKEYTEDVTAGIEQAVDEESKALVDAIRADAPKKTGEYAKGWTRKKVGSAGEVQYVIYNKSKPWLAHLLENGHAKRGGGRVAGKPHIRPNYRRTEEQLTARIRGIIRNGG